ncbi:MAG TPA: hypothetical protein PLC04_01055 [Candidatus Kapabacteria bacterium]|nr:hypothetical protein [Candidatus Kapabacteria bacterium]HOV91654.1 hypothetical protein [Candidatus Kapabacteria bacterium]
MKNPYSRNGFLVSLGMTVDKLPVSSCKDAIYGVSTYVAAPSWCRICTSEDAFGTTL